MSIRITPHRSFLISLLTAVVLTTCLWASTAEASVGYLLRGQGVRYRALSGAGVALHLDPTASALNPGAMAFVPAGYDLSLAFTLPNSGYTVTGEPSADQDTYFGLAPGDVSGDGTILVAPTLSGNWCLNRTKTVRLGLTVFSQGGMKTEYGSGVYDGSANPAGVDLTQMSIMPTISCSLGGRHGLGVSPFLTIQRYRARGLDAFAARGWSSDPDNLTGSGTATAYGYGARIGYLGKLSESVAVGASYQTVTRVSAYESYAGWLAEQGTLENPASWTVGVALGSGDKGLALDIQQVLFGSRRSLGNPMLPNLDDSLLGDDEGAGSGWRDPLGVRLGGWYRTSSGWMLRTGFATGQHPVEESEILLNLLTPQVARHQVSFGMSRPLGWAKDFGVVVAYAFGEELEGPNPLEAPGAQTLSLRYSQWELGAGLSF